MSEYWITESGYNWLRENLKFIVVGIMLLLFVFVCCCIAGLGMTTKSPVGKSSVEVGA